ncbi:MAG: DNA translocase FtsK [Holdemanella sp.]|nr:DNA translocase FtsK [Holdemanella sp.]
MDSYFGKTAPKRKQSIFMNEEDVYSGGSRGKQPRYTNDIEEDYSGSYSDKFEKSSIFRDVDDICDKRFSYSEKATNNSLTQSKDSIFINVDPSSSQKKAERKRNVQQKPKETKPEVVKPAVEKVEVVKDKSKPATYVDTRADNYENYQLPRLSLLESVSRKGRQNGSNAQNAKSKGVQLIEVLNEFGIEAKLSDVHIGPSVTRFEIKPAMGVRVSRISNLQDDIKYALAARELRIEAPIPGKSAVGIEIPNSEKVNVQMRELMDTIPENGKNDKLLFVLGRDLDGYSIFARMDKMPHLLIAGATGSGKSVCVNSIICSFLLRTRPDELKLILVDPKKVEFTPYNDVPHLLAPVITDADMANKALKVVVEMMDKRYEKFGELGVRNIDGYNTYLQNNPDQNLKPLPRIVVIIDELADLMLVAAKEVESSIQRITQLARAAGIHLIVATQRPSVNVITGVIKANIPSRIAFAVSSAIDSRTILDQAGADKLLGNGDMLYLPNGENSPQRIQGVFIRDEEVNRIAEYVKNQAKPHYDDAFITLKDIASQGGTVSQESNDPLYNDVKSFVIQQRRASTSLIQRRFQIGYGRAARLIDCLEADGIVGPANGSKPREILVQNTLEDDYSDIY